MSRTHTRRAALLMTVWASAWSADPDAAGQRRPPRDRAAAVAATASVSGRVMTGSPPSPLSDAVVAMRSETGKIIQSAITGADVRFALTALPHGRYTLSASKGGYLTLRYGSNSNQGRH